LRLGSAPEAGRGWGPGRRWSRHWGLGRVVIRGGVGAVRAEEPAGRRPRGRQRWGIPRRGETCKSAKSSGASATMAAPTTVAAAGELGSGGFQARAPPPPQPPKERQNCRVGRQCSSRSDKNGTCASAASAGPCCSGPVLASTRPNPMSTRASVPRGKNGAEEERTRLRAPL